MIVERRIDEDFAKSQFPKECGRLPMYLVETKKEPKNLSRLIDVAWGVVGYGCVADPQSPEIPKALQIAADAHNALFVTAANPSNPNTVRLGEGEPVTYTSAPDESTVHVSRWINGFYFNVLAGNTDSIDSLCRIPPDLLRRSSTQVSDYQYLYMEALQALGNNKMENIVKTMLAAVKATDPNRPDVFDPDWTLYLHVPQLEVLIYAVTKDPKFGEALLKAVQLHKKYWEKTKLRRRDEQAAISIQLTALAAIGRYRGLSFDVESPFLAMHLAKQ